MSRQIEDEVEYLLEKYYENFAGGAKPLKSSIIGHLRSVLQETTQATLEPLVISVAKDGFVLTRNSLLVAKAKRDAPPPKPTWTPDQFVAENYINKDAVPMPEYVKQMVEEIRKRNYNG